jgi:predicted HD superfamily hydrolase involved in NAD metabolism
LPAGLQAHIHRATSVAIELAPLHGVDLNLAILAIKAHDIARAMTNEDLMVSATHWGLPIGVVECHVPILLHGPVGAELVRRQDGLEHPAVYQAIYWHTTAHPLLDDLGKVVFLADKLDPWKIDRYPYLPQLRELAMENLDRALLEFLDREITSRLRQGLTVHPVSLECRNALLIALR